MSEVEGEGACFSYSCPEGSDRVIRSFSCLSLISFAPQVGTLSMMATAKVYVFIRIPEESDSFSLELLLSSRGF